MMEIIVFFALIILMTIYVARPYQFRFQEADTRRMNGTVKTEELNELEETRDSFLQAIKEIEFDHEVGQLSDDDFNEMNAKYRRKTIDIMKSMDRLRDGEVSGSRSADKICPVCSAIRSAQDRFCHNCGTPFQTAPDDE